MTDHYDVIVIGSGAGGGTVTYALAPTGQRCCFSSGAAGCPARRRTGTRPRCGATGAIATPGSGSTRTASSSTPSSTTTSAATPSSTERSCSGSASGTSARSSTSTAVSPSWPISLRRLRTLVHAGRAALLGARRARRRPDRPTGQRGPTLSGDQPRAADRGAGAAISSGAGLHPFPLPERHPDRRGRAENESPCVRCSTCDGFPCLVNGKADAQVVCVEPALRYPNVTLRTDAQVTRLETTRPAAR